MRLASAVAVSATIAVLLALRTTLLRRRRARACSEAPLVGALCLVPCADAHVALTGTDAADFVRSEGVCIVRDVLDSREVAELAAEISDLTPRKKQNRRTLRWELVHEPDAKPFVQLAAHPVIKRLVLQLLGPKVYLEKAGLIRALPGAEAQRWHMDTPHLFSNPTHLPPQSLSVFVPLCELTASNGPTEFELATHVKANLVRPRRRCVACCPLGSIVAYDPRVMHRGGANLSVAERPLCYLTFSRIWFRDTFNP